MWVKICGLTSAEEAQNLVPLAPSAVGLNFYSRSSRGLTPAKAQEIALQIPPSILKVGVFVDQTPAEIVEIAEQTGLDLIQFHGNYTPADVLAVQGRPFLWVHRMGPAGLAPLQAELQEFRSLSLQPYACLIDAQVQGHFGGSGQRVDWIRLANEYDKQSHPPLILAGGLHPENLQQAIQTVQPWGVDVASGVETAGKKDLVKCAQFLKAAQRSF